MSITENLSGRREKAIQKFNDRIEAANKKAAEREANILAQEERRQKLYEDWPRLADGIITDLVNSVSEDFVHLGSPIFLAAATLTPSGAGGQRQSEKSVQAHLATSPRSFDARHKGQSQSVARLQFEIDISTGKISATATIKGAELPPSILLSQFEPEWASQAAEAVLLAILEG